MVRPREEWKDSPCCLPSGRVREVVVNASAIYIEGDPRGWSPHAFELDEQGSLAVPPQTDDWVLSNWEPMVVLWNRGWYSVVVIPRRTDEDAS